MASAHGIVTVMVLVLAGALLIAPPAGAQDCRVNESGLLEVAESAQRFDTLRTLHVGMEGETVIARGYRGVSPDAATNVKSASKTLIAAVVGAAIERGVLSGVDARVADLLPDALPPQPDPRLDELSVAHLLSMQAGLERTSGENYGAWVASDNWVESVLDQPVSGRPGGEMRYSTGNTHVLSAILERRTGNASYALANRWLAPAGVEVVDWITDPQGIAFGGNQVAMRPAALLALGELYRRDGVTASGQRLLPASWVDASWQIRGRSRWTNDGYGYGWFIREFAGHEGYYGWGYGGQMLYVIPNLSMTVVITSDADHPSGRTGYRDQLHALTERLARSACHARTDRASRQRDRVDGIPRVR